MFCQNIHFVLPDMKENYGLKGYVYDILSKIYVQFLIDILGFDTL